MNAVGVEVDLRKYKTEYRAYSYQEGITDVPYTHLDNTVQNEDFEGKLFSAWQLAIFKQLYNNPNYAYVKENWDANAKAKLADGLTTFRDAVQAYWNLDSKGFNKYNSVWVNDFYRALDEVGTKKAHTHMEQYLKADAVPISASVSDENEAKVRAVLVVVRKLKKMPIIFSTNVLKWLRKLITI